MLKEVNLSSLWLAVEGREGIVLLGDSGDGCKLSVHENKLRQEGKVQTQGINFLGRVPHEELELSLCIINQLLSSDAYIIQKRVEMFPK